MALADDIRALRDRVLADLNGAHDYYTDTKNAWDLVCQVIAAGHTFSIQNMTTGTVTTQADLASKAPGYVAEQLAEATFQQFILAASWASSRDLCIWSRNGCVERLGGAEHPRGLGLLRHRRPLQRERDGGVSTLDWRG